jgi:hypothetical protein
MDTLTFIAKIAEALAWPLATVALVALLRGEIRSLVPLIRRVKAGPVEAEFERGTEELKERLPLQPGASEALAHTPPPKAAEPPIGTNPRSEVLEAWLQLEAVANDALFKKQLKGAHPGAIVARPSLRGLAEALRANGLLHEGQLSLFQELQHLRNNVVHTLEFAPTQEALTRYIETANYLKWWLQQAAEKPD